MKVKIFDLKIKNKKLQSDLIKSFKKVLKHGQFFLGPEVKIFENRIKKFLGVKYALGVDSGSSALYLALKSAGIGYGDEVLTTPLTWIITTSAIAATGAKPVFVDIREDLNIDPEKIQKKINRNTKAIVPMHYAGHMCDMEKIKKIAKKNNLLIIEDAAQSFGASLNGKKSGTFSDVASFSMNPMKTLGGFGEAGAIVTNHKEIYEKCKILRHAGTTSDPKKIITNKAMQISLNHKMDTINAALLLVSLKNLKEKFKKKFLHAKIYDEKLTKKVKTPQIFKNEIHGRYVYPIIVDKRNQLREYLAKHGIETKIYHEPLTCDAPIFKKYNNYDTPIAYKMIKKVLAIPLHENLKREQIFYVIEKINKFYEKF